MASASVDHYYRITAAEDSTESISSVAAVVFSTVWRSAGQVVSVAVVGDEAEDLVVAVASAGAVASAEVFFAVVAVVAASSSAVAAVFLVGNSVLSVQSPLLIAEAS